VWLNLTGDQYQKLKRRWHQACTDGGHGGAFACGCSDPLAVSAATGAPGATLSPWVFSSTRVATGTSGPSRRVPKTRGLAQVLRPRARSIQTAPSFPVR
jgi:hypothetical protein